MSRKTIVGMICAIVLLVEVIIYILETLLSDNSNSIRKACEKAHQLEHQQTNYNNAWYTLFLVTAIIGAVTIMTIPNKRIRH